MANNVFANGLEIACKAAAGKSVAAFPDPCFTPPAPPAGWIVVPYANTTYAKDTTNGSKTVFISGKPIMKKDVSFFKTSTGDEPAAGPLGISTGVKKGKAYFTSWSMNVKVEGKNVDRHTDGMTHNHGSRAGNTGVFQYMDSWYGSRDCKKEFDKIEEKCTKKSGGEKFNWKKKNCKLLNIKPQFHKNKDSGYTSLVKKLEKAKKEAEKLKSPAKLKKVLQEMSDDVVGEIESAAADKVSSLVAKRLIPLYGQVTIPFAIKEAAEDSVALYDAYQNIENKVSSLMTEVPKYPDRIGQIITEYSKSEPGKIDGDSPSKILADLQSDYALMNGCLRARKCALVPFGDTDKKCKKSGKCPKGQKKVSVKNQKGCCSGQTGHHLMPDSYFTIPGKGNRGKKDKDICDGYNMCDAPVVCVEGANHGHGSHGQMHDTTDKRAKEATTGFFSGGFGYEKARDVCIESLNAVFPFSFCSNDCLIEQLDNYYDCACENWWADDLNKVESENYNESYDSRESAPLNAISSKNGKDL